MAFDRRYIDMIPPVTRFMLIANIAVFAAMWLLPASTANMITYYGGLHYIDAPDFYPWQLFTYMFIHANFTHLFFNMFALYMFGMSIEYALGSKRFLFYYLSCGVGAALVQLGVWALMIPSMVDNAWSGILSKYAASNGISVSEALKMVTEADYAFLHNQVVAQMLTIGASGAVYGVLLAYGMLFPNRTLMLLIPPMPIKAKWLVIGYAVLELALGMTSHDGVAHFAHLGGMIFGFLIILYWKRKGTFIGYY